MRVTKTTWTVGALLLAAVLLAAFQRPGSVKNETEFSIYLLGQLDRTYVSVSLNETSLAGGFVSTHASLGVAF